VRELRDVLLNPIHEFTVAHLSVPSASGSRHTQHSIAANSEGGVQVEGRDPEGGTGSNAQGSALVCLLLSFHVPFAYNNFREKRRSGLSQSSLTTDPSHPQ
jgi:hypothetical protein